MKSGLLVLAVTSCIGLNACTMVNPDTIEKQDPPVLSENVLQPIPTLATEAVEPKPLSNDKPELRVTSETNPLFLRRKNKVSQTAGPGAPAAPVAQQEIQTTAPVEATPAPAPVLSTWQPNEAYLFRGQELIAGLQREKGRQPSPQEMLQRLQTHMGLSAAQAQQIIATLGF